MTGRRFIRPVWRYHPGTRILRISGHDFAADLRAMKIDLQAGSVTGPVDALVYEIAGTKVCVLVTGYHLLKWTDGPYAIGIFYPTSQTCG